MAVSTAAIILKNRKVLLAQRMPTGSMASRWEFPGGKVEGEESLEEALARELKEEFGLPVQVKELLVPPSSPQEYPVYPCRLHG